MIFGKSDGNTIVAELVCCGTDDAYFIRYNMNLEGQKFLDFTDATITNKWDTYRENHHFLNAKYCRKGFG